MHARSPDSWMHDNRLRLLELLVPGVAHEINNRDQSILLGASLLAAVWGDLIPLLERLAEDHGEFSAGGLPFSALCSELPDHIEYILRGAREIEAIVTELRALARSDSDKPTLVDINKIISASLLLAAHPLRRAAERLETELATGLPRVLTSAPLVSQALLNVLFGACHATERRRESIRVRSRLDSSPGRPQRVVCEVLAEGVGPSAEERRLVLQGVRASAAPPSSAASLEAAAAIMALLGGELELGEESRDGTPVRLSLPVQPERSP